MALIDYVLALCALLGTLVVPFLVLHQMLRLKRRAIRVTAGPAPRSSAR